MSLELVETSRPPALVNGQAVAPSSWTPLYWMALGTFAIGTEGFMVAGILPAIGRDLDVDARLAGQLVTIFSLVYALSSPVLTVLTQRIDRRKLLVLAMGGFALANIVAAVAPSYLGLAAARVLLAAMAGLYTPNAAALAGAIVAPERRGRALALISGGLSAAVALGVPLGAWVGNMLGWRVTFVGVAGLAALAFAGLLFGTRPGIGGNVAVASLRERIAVIGKPGAARGLLMTTAWALGGYTVYTYIAPYLGHVAGLAGASLSPMLFLWGAAAFAGILTGGFASDRFGARFVHAITLPAMMLALASLSVTAYLVAPGSAFAPVAAAILIWGFMAWGSFPAQQTRLIGMVGLKHASVILSLNASFMYLGFALGAALGSVILMLGTVADLGWVGGLGVGLAILLRFVRAGRPAS